MRKILLFASTLAMMLCATIKSSAQGWPANYSGVMLQGFSWDSYTETQWPNLESQADELSEYFNIIWVPNSAYAGGLTNNMGYHPVYWFDHKSAFGTADQLRSMIKAFKAKGTGIIEDVVINHRAGVSTWVNFPAETYKGVTYQLGLSDICSDDECKDNGYKPTGNKDTGEPWNGARDLDHTSANVQKNVNAYLDFLKNDLGYTGFRYDFVKGYAAKYVGQYNATAKPEFSVGECWDGYTTITSWINGTKVDGVIQSAAFDFPMKYNINDAFDNGTWSKLNTSTLAASDEYKRYGVTFIDNHDTYKDGGALKAHIEAAHAYLLTMPGTPCVFLRHWVQYKTPIKKMIFLRKAAGITNMSDIDTKSAETSGYVLKVKGKNSDVLVVLGTAKGASTSGMKLALEGDYYKIYVNNSLNISGLDNIKEEENNFTAPDFCKPEEGKLYAFFEAPAVWTSTIKCWCWNDKSNFTGGTWPGTSCTLVGTASNGSKVWKWTGPALPDEMPTGIIFSNNGISGQQTTDMKFTNGGYYTSDGLQGEVITSINGITVDSPTAKHTGIYTLSGQRIDATSIDALPRGIYIVNGKKIAK